MSRRCALPILALLSAFSCGAESPAGSGGSTVTTTSASVTTSASTTSLASVQRRRPKPWVHAYRKVPVSSSRARSGAPRNAPISAGTACST